MRRLVKRAVSALVGTYCPVCGRRTLHTRQHPLSQHLIDEWGLPDRWTLAFNEREGFCCGGCGSSLRSRHLALVLVEELNTRLRTRSICLSELARSPDFQGLHIAEVNAAGSLHRFLAEAPNLAYSEYSSKSPHIPSEDLMHLSYASDSFDLVLHSETLEHVPDVCRALDELWRVLRPGGLNVFTIPVLWDRLVTRRRAQLESG